MLRIGLTGGIAAGKSAVAAELGRLGAVIVDADLLARAVVEPGTEGLDEVVAAFGPGVLGTDGALDRPALGRLVFRDRSERERLNAIVHPRVRAEAARLIERAPGDAVVVEDIPLLVETRQAARFHLVIVVDAPDEQRIARMVERRGMDPGDARQRITAQASRAERLAAADAVLVNDRALNDLLTATTVLWERRIVPFRDNLAAGRPAPRSDGPEASPTLAGAGAGAGAGAVDTAVSSADVVAGGDAAAWGLPGTSGLERRMTGKLVAALSAGMRVGSAAPGSATQGLDRTDDVVRAHLQVRLGQEDDRAEASTVVTAAGFPRDAERGGSPSTGALVLHRSADPAIDVTVTISSPPRPD
ncbi:dephospho-CoA kinase [Arthrobacter sp. PL16]|uniref:dephospho-CoA kinase n=1 Tax=Arthrobacter sp. PL16 TaxID=3071720 RepID=UPI002E09BE9A|nr:dephospho-CoA kinase [Arthrobacter sp. PL16]